MIGEEEGIEKALHKIEEIEQRIELDEEKLHKDERELKEAIHDLEKAEQHGAIIVFVDGDERKVHRGEWVVLALKAELGVDPAKVLAEITPHGLKDLEDSATITLHQKERFMTHARSGGSS